MYKLIGFDMDDTLCPAKNKADKEMIELLEKLLEKYKVLVTTGGMFENINKQILSGFSDKANLENLYLFPTNSTKKFHFENGEWINDYDLSMSENEIDKIINTLNKAIIDLELEPEKVWGDIVENRGFSQVTYSSLGQKAPLESKRLWDPNKKIRQKIIEYIKDDLSEYSIGIGGTTSIDITKKGLNKSYFINKVSDYYNINKEEILYIGDSLFEGGNDYVVAEAGVDCKQVENPEDTKKIIRKLI